MTTVVADEPALLHPEHGAASWRAIGTYVDVRTTPAALERAVELVTAVIEEVDEACSRFRTDSDLALVNARPGQPVLVSPLLVGAVRVALESAQETGGIVDPTLGTVLAAAGYDRTYALVPSDDPSPAALPVPRGSWRDVVVDDSTVCIPPGVALDLGATGKAFAADLAALTVVDQLGVPVLVSIGGDIRVAGPDGAHVPHQPVRLGHSLADLAAGGDSSTIRVGAGGIATSSVSARRWRRGGRQWHHLVDPRTGEPADGPWRTVTALGHTAVAANTASTAAVVLGSDALAWLTARDVAARLVGHDGRIRTTAAWDARESAAETEEPS